MRSLDDNHGSAAVRAGLCEAWFLIGLVGGFGFVSRCRQVEQLTHPGKVLGTPAIGQEPIVTNAVEAMIIVMGFRRFPVAVRVVRVRDRKSR